MKEQGKHAASTGAAHEQIMRSWIEQAGYSEINPALYLSLRRHIGSDKEVVDWCRKHCAGKRVFIWRQQTLKSIYGIPWRIDFTVWDENLWSRGLFIEAKSRSTSGSVDEKLPFVIASLKNNPCPSGLLLEGEGFRDAAKQWALEQQTDQFRVWTNPSRMRAYIETGKVVKEREGKTMILNKQASLAL